MSKTRLTASVVMLLAAVVIYFTPRAPDKLAEGKVFGRTLCPWCPPVVQKRIHPSGEGVFLHARGWFVEMVEPTGTDQELSAHLKPIVAAINKQLPFETTRK